MHAERKTATKLELRDELEHFASKFVSGPIKPQINKLLVLIEEGINCFACVVWFVSLSAQRVRMTPGWDQ